MPGDRQMKTVGGTVPPTVFLFPKIRGTVLCVIDTENRPPDFGRLRTQPSLRSDAHTRRTVASQ